MKRVTNKEEEYKRTRLQIALGGERIGVYTHAITAEFREHAENDPDTLWECEAIENTLAYLRLSLALASHELLRQGNEAFFLDESDRIAERLDGQICDMINTPPMWRKSTIGSPSKVNRYEEIIRANLDEINTLMGRLRLGSNDSYGWDKEWPKDAADAKEFLGEHAERLALSTFAVTKHLRSCTCLHPETLRICDDLEEKLRGLLLATNNMIWYWNSNAIAAPGYRREDMAVQFHLYAVPFIGSFLSLLDGPDASRLTGMETTISGWDYLHLPKYLLSLARVYFALLHGARENSLEDLPAGAWTKIRKHTLAPIDMKECYALAMNSFKGKEAAEWDTTTGRPARRCRNISRSLRKRPCSP